jgi:hypothetical protein
MAYSIITAAASDTYFNNPESWIQAKSGDPDGDISRAFRDIANTAHRDADTEGIMRKCLVCDGFAGFGVHWAYFEQVEDAPPVAASPPQLGAPNSELGTPTPTDAAQPPPQPPNVVAQKVCGDFCEPWDFRVDPDGRDWKLTDHKYIIRKYRKTIAQLLEYSERNGASRARLPRIRPSHAVHLGQEPAASRKSISRIRSGDRTPARSTTTSATCRSR